MSALQESILQPSDSGKYNPAVDEQVQNLLEEFGVEVQTGHLAVKNGTSTELTKFLSSLVGNPIQTTLETATKYHNSARAIVDQVFVKTFLTSCSDFIKGAYRTQTSFDDLHYSIILKEDTTENRSKVFAFLDKYNLSDLSVQIPVYFRFIAAEREDKIRYSEKINLE